MSDKYWIIEIGYKKYAIKSHTDAINIVNSLDQLREVDYNPGYKDFHFKDEPEKLVTEVKLSRVTPHKEQDQ